uniref:Caspase family p20 domain-containing protein n=1 Tax=Candidatus Kentrum sp. FW TaxID=2126338 RepID=A0A450TUD0_9GAMM|nr:MAG: Protein of unknown function (DUF1566) [Candidatus Kentron sp. FW]
MKNILATCLFLMVEIFSWPLLAAGRGVILLDGEREVLRYGKSYALLIGVSDYKYWNDLTQVHRELDQVAEMLKTQGFEIVRINDPSSDQLIDAFKDFKNKYGFKPENRLLFFFSGHGHTRNRNSKGYLVPRDAPIPDQDETDFLSKALPMTQILAWAREIEVYHALFLFDSCFSGTVFKQRALSKRASHITKSTAGKVRQFITAGDAGEEVPAKSTFTPAFVDAILYGKADLYKDGYITGTELGLYLKSEVPKYVHQNPQFGKIKDYELARGDFVFVLKPDQGPTPPVANVNKDAYANSSAKQILQGTPHKGGRFSRESQSTVYDSKLQKRWRVVKRTIFTWDEAIHYSNLNKEWRLPSISEFQSLIDEYKPWGPIRDNFPKHGRVTEYWASEPDSYINFSTGILETTVDKERRAGVIKISN